MVERNNYEDVVDGDYISQGYFNESKDVDEKAIICNLINQMNLTETIKYPHTYVDILTTDSADTKTNWTYNATDDQYENQQTSLATLQFDNVLETKQLENLPGGTKALLYVDYETSGDAITGIVNNPSFETVGTGGADAFADWTESTSGDFSNWTQSTSNVTDGTYSASVSGSSGSEPSGTATLTQTIDCTNLTFVSVDYYQDITGGVVAPAGTASLDVGGISDSDSIGSNTGGTNTGTLYVDVSSLSGNQTITLTGSMSSSGGGAQNGGSTYRFDNVVTYSNSSTTNQTTTFSLSPNGSTAYETVTNGELVDLSSAITNIGIKITETNTEASSDVFSKINAIGVFLI